MANKKKNTLKKKKNNTTKKKITTTNTKSNIKNNNTKKVNNKSNKNSNKSKTVKKEESKKVSTNIELPKLKDEEKVDKVVFQEKYNNEDKKEDNQEIKNDSVKKTTKKKKSNAKKIASKKKSSLKKRFDKLLRKIKIYGIQSVLPIKLIIGISITVILFISIITLLGVILHKDRAIDLQLIPSKIDQLKTVSFDITESSDIIKKVVEENKAYESAKSLKEYYEYDFDSVFHLNKKYVDEYVIRYNDNNKELFIAIKATDGNQDKIEETMNNFMKEKGIKDYEYLNYQGYQIYINSKNNAIVRSKVMQSQIRVFNILQELRKDDIEDMFGIKDSDFNEALFKTPMLKNNDTCEYIIIKPKNKETKEKIKEQMNKHFNDLEEKWKDSNNENYNLVKNRLENEYKGYLIYIVSHNNELVYELIKG